MQPIESAIANRLSSNAAIDPETRERIHESLALARRRLERVARRRPVLSFAVALAAGYLAGRVVTKTL